MATVYKCKNGSCKHMVDLRCTLEEIEIDNGGECEYQEYQELT